MPQKTQTKKERLEAAGWKETSVVDFLGLTASDMEWIYMRESMVETLRTLRATSGLTQQALAKELSTSQSRIAKMEASDPSVSLDLLMRAIFHLGGTFDAVNREIAKRKRREKTERTPGPRPTKPSVQRTAARNGPKRSTPRHKPAELASSGR